MSSEQSRSISARVRWRDLRLGREVFLERNVALPGLHRGALHGFVGGLPLQAALGELEQDGLLKSRGLS